MEQATLFLEFNFRDQVDLMHVMVPPSIAQYPKPLHPPDLTTGLPMPAIDNWGDPAQRTPSGTVWRTVMKALGIPEAEYVGKFHPQVDSAAALDFMLKS